MNAASHAQSVPTEESGEPLLREMCEPEAVSARLPDDKGIKEVREALRTTFINGCMIKERFQTLEQMRTVGQKRFTTNVCKKERRILTH